MRLFNNWLNRLGNPTNVYEANSREANENLLLDTYMLVLTDKKNITETRLPLDKVTGIIKDEVLTIVDGNSVTTDYIPFNEMSPTFQMNKKYEYSGGKVGIGPFALNNKNHVLTQLVNLMFAENDLLRSLGFTGLNGIKSQNERVYKRDTNGNIVLDKNGLPIYEDEEGLNILDWISAMINAHVDVAKDPYVIRLNVRQYTYNICNFLLRSGFGKNTFYFLPQNILKEMAVAYERADGIYGIKSGSKTSIVNEEIGNIIRRYYDNYSKACADSKISPVIDIDEKGVIVLRNKQKLEDLAPSLMSRDELISNIQDGKKVDKLSSQEKATYYLNQLYYAKLFLELNNLAQDMSKLVQLSQIDTKRYGNNFVEQDRFVYRLKSFLNTQSLFKRSDVEHYFTDTFLFTKLVNGVLMPASIFEDTMLRSKQSFKDSITKVLTLVRRDNINDEALNKVISNELEGQLRWQFLSTVDDFNLFDMLYGKNSMAQRLQSIKNDILAGKYPEMRTADGKIANRLLNHLQSLTKFSTDQYNAPAIIGSNRVNETDKFLKQDLKMYWEELLESPHDEIRKFANDLIYYQLATTAGNFTKNGIWNLLPISALTSTGYADFMDNITRNFNETSLNFNNLFLNNWSNSKLVPEVSIYRTQFDQELGEEYQADAFYMAKGDILIDGVKTRVPIVMQPNMGSVGVNAQGQPIYTPYIKVAVNRRTPEGILLYRFVGTTLDDKGSVTPLYVITNKKGLNYGGRVVKEYDDYSNSIFNFNNIKSANQSLKNKSVGLLSNGQINQQDVIKVIDQLCDNADDRRRLAQSIKDSFELIQDYLPNSKALNSQILTLGIDNTENEGTAEFTQTSESQGDKIEEEDTNNSVFKFKSGFQIQLPFTLNDQQKKALLVLEDFINNPKKYNNVITLCGYAGTGKSTLIGIFDKYLKSKYLKIKYSAPTHRANAVTKMNNPDVNVQTLHSLFGLRPTVDLTDGVYDLRALKNEQLNKPSLKDGDILVIDESSMISKALYRFIEEYVRNHNVKIIYVGDDAQLAPVNDDTISPVFTGNQTKIQLTKVERTGDNAILAESTRLRNKQDFSYETRDNVEFTNSTDRANEIIDTIVKSDEFKGNPLYFRILSATNDMISNANDRVRNILYGDNPKQLMVGDIMMGYNNINDPNDELGGKLISNSIDYVITEVGDRVSKSIHGIKVYGYDTIIREANSDTYAQIFVLDNNTTTETLQQLSDIYKDINTQISNAFKNHEYSKLRALFKDKAVFESQTITMRDFYGDGNKLLLRKSLDYGYAHTIHKSQGGTYNNVLIYADTIDRFSDPLIRQQLKYVAVSRAKDNVTILTSHPTTGTREVITDQVEQSTNPKDYHLYSGGAVGADFMWGEIGKEYGLPEANHYQHPEKMPTNVKQFSSRRDMLKGMFNDADAFIGEVSKSPYTKKGDNFVLKNNTDVEKLISAISKRGIPKSRINSLLSKESLDYLTEGTDSTSYYNIGYSSGQPEIMAVTNRDLYDEAYEPKTIAYLRDEQRMNQPVSSLQTSTFKNTSTFLVDGDDKISVEFFRENGYKYIVYNTNNITQSSEQTQVEQSTNPKDYNLYSGGAVGADTKWGEIANKYNIGKIRHYRPETLDVLTPEQMQEVETAYVASANKLGRKILDSNTLAGKLVRRDYLQAKAADSIFAIGHILRPGEKNSKGYTVRSTIPSVDGGTGYAVQMAIDLHKPVHVFDQQYKHWYRFDYDQNTFVSEDIPTLTTKFAGVGTRQINKDGINAIEQVFQKTFGIVQNQPQQSNALNIWYSSNENADLSNFAIRPFVYLGYNFKSVEQAFQFFKWSYSSNSRDNQIIANNILLETQGSTLKRLGRQFKGFDAKAWDANSSRIMKELIKASFEQNNDAKQRLIDTGNTRLTHGQDKGKWGIEFPKLLMEVREELKPVPQPSPSRFDLSQFATMNEEELNSDPNMEQMDRDGKNLKDYCNNK